MYAIFPKESGLSDLDDNSKSSQVDQTFYIAGQQDVILIVDDTPSNLQVLFNCLEKSGYKVLVAQTGEKA